MAGALPTTTTHVFLWRPPERNIEVFARAGHDAVARKLDGIALEHALVHTTCTPPPRLTLVPFQRVPVALASLRGDAEALERARVALSALPGTLEGWRTETAVPVAATAATDTTLLTLFRQRPGIERALFLQRWHHEHTPMTLEIHPLVGYVRHVVHDALVPGSARWDGVVTEDYAEARDLTSLRLFGRGPRAIANAVRIGRHVSSFLDLRTIENYLVRGRPA